MSAPRSGYLLHWQPLTSLPATPSAKAAWRPLPVLLTLTLVADSFALVLVVVAVFSACVPQALAADRPYGEIKLGTIALATLAAVGAARALSWLIERLGGYRVVPGNLLEFLAYRDTLQVVSRNVLVLAENLPSLYRCGIPERLHDSGDRRVARVRDRSAALDVGIFRGSPVSFPGRRLARCAPEDFVGHVLWFSAVLCLAAYLASSIPKDRATMRYMIPFVLCGAVLTGRVLAERADGVRTAVVALTLLGRVLRRYGAG